MGGANSALKIVQQAYQAFERGDVPGILALIGDDIEWRFCGSRRLPYTGTFRSKPEIARWFASVSEVDDIQAFEPRELIPAGDRVTVLGWERTKARPGGTLFETEWVHVFTVHGGRIVRFWGMYDTEASAAARR